MGNENKKGYNNPNDWEKIESKNPATKIIDVTEDFTGIIDENSDNPLNGGEFEETENFEHEENFTEVLELTQYDDKNLPANNDKFFVAEYNDVQVVELEKKHKQAAKSFVNRITKFILDFNDVTLSVEHEKYIKQVGALQLQHLEDLLYLVDVNKQMLNNIIARVNATQAEDYAIINSYNNLANQHLKLIKELQNTYKSIPNVLKKMKADVLCNQELSDDGNPEDEVITSEFGESQFNNSKQMLRAMIEKRNQKQNPTEADDENADDFLDEKID
jgi:hypothetical protein